MSAHVPRWSLTAGSAPAAPAARGHVFDAFAVVPPAIGALAASLQLLVGAAEPMLLAAAVGAELLAGVLAGRWLSRLHRSAIDGHEREGEARLQQQRNFLCGPLPVWRKQVETVRTEADAQVAQIARVAGEFVRRLDGVIRGSAVGAGAAGDQQAFLDDLGGTSEGLCKLVRSLQKVQASKRQVVGEIGIEAARLKESAEAIRSIALSTRMVALNATIEAARAGDSGRAFATVAAGMRELAVHTAEASEGFSRQTDRLHRMVSAAFHEDADPQAQEGSIPWAEQLVNELLGRFQAMGQQVGASRTAVEVERRELRQQVASMLISLQFQDRVSQILSHLSGHLQDMQAQLARSDPAALDQQRWMEQMSATYSTPEEIRNLHDRPAVQADTPAITFF